MRARANRTDEPFEPVWLIMLLHAMSAAWAWAAFASRELIVNAGKPALARSCIDERCDLIHIACILAVIAIPAEVPIEADGVLTSAA
jgi:hypothetical protein